ncbi:MAG: Possible two-component regulator [uncultured Sulfurovum sp.]|uniref:Possible two-component regulator n=1 Tax=uncultured Sulfurovum sp. TaxID=269237 RepID=A0A6S6U0H7_9BACT|nr:MAG: Possible two-component regulator [uncultured Sulfurovum sp.]
MKITIIENEMYFAQSIADKLSRCGFKVEIFSSIKDVMLGNNKDIYLLSSNILGGNINTLIKKFQKQIVILMLNNQNNNFIQKAFSNGMNDYIIKPFHPDELINKIKHHQEFNDLKVALSSYKSYLNYSFKDKVQVDVDLNNFTPLVIESDASNYIDTWLLEHHEAYGQLVNFIPIMQGEWKQAIKEAKHTDILYLKNKHYLNAKEIKGLFKLLQGKKFILSTSVPIESEYKTLKIDSENNKYQGYEIMTIEKYVQYIILQYQYKHPDTVISKKLGFSRKSLHKRRIKYNIYKVKTSISNYVEEKSE